MPAQLVFRTERAGQLHGIFEFERVRDIFMQLLQRGQADLAEHLRLNFRCGVGDIGVVVETSLIRACPSLVNEVRVTTPITAPSALMQQSSSTVAGQLSLNRQPTQVCISPGVLTSTLP